MLFMDRIEEKCNAEGIDRNKGKGAIFAHELGHYMAHIKHEDNHDSPCIMIVPMKERIKHNFCSQCLIRIQVQMPRGSEVFRGGTLQGNQEATR